MIEFSFRRKDTYYFRKIQIYAKKNLHNNGHTNKFCTFAPDLGNVR